MDHIGVNHFIPWLFRKSDLHRRSNPCLTRRRTIFWRSAGVIESGRIPMISRTNKEAVVAIVRITKGNIRLIERLMMQVERVLVANQFQVVTKEVVETARQNLIIGPG